MPDYTPIPAGAPAWIDLASSDPDASREFYGSLFGWTFESAPEEFGGYISAYKDGRQVAGIMQAQDGGVADAWSVYLAVDDAAATNEAVTESGGTVALEPMPVGDLGTMGFVVDPSGGFVGEWQFGTHRGFGVVGVPGAPSWFELHSRDYAAALAFYQSAFGWTTESVGDTDEFRYSVLTIDGLQRAGLMDAKNMLPEGVPSHWVVYFGAENTDLTLTNLVDLGGRVVRAPEDTPYGRLSTVTDSTGSIFNLLEQEA